MGYLCRALPGIKRDSPAACVVFLSAMRSQLEIEVHKIEE